MFTFAHVSDVHLDGTGAIAARARRVFDYLATIPGPLDAVVVTGDIADHGTDAEYAEAKAALAVPYPLIVGAGNHDERRAFRRSLLGRSDADVHAGPINIAHQVGGVTFAMCDSSIPGRDDGFLDDETIGWLDATLATAPGPAFACFHHPPVDLAQPFIDRIRMGGEDRLAAVIGRHPHVVALLCGHAHTATATVFAGRPCLIAPGVKNTLVMPWETASDRRWMAKRRWRSHSTSSTTAGG